MPPRAHERIFLWPKSCRPIQYAPPISTSVHKPTPAIGRHAPTVPAKTLSPKAAKPTKVKPAIRIRAMIGCPSLSQAEGPPDEGAKQWLWEGLMSLPPTVAELHQGPRRSQEGPLDGHPS